MLKWPRLELKEINTELMIRATNGHSISYIDRSLIMKKLEMGSETTHSIGQAYHWTTREKATLITKSGLSSGVGYLKMS